MPARAAADGGTQAPSAPAPTEPGETLRLEGRIAEGPECPVLRTPEGQTYSLVGRGVRFTPGAYVEITGRPVAISFCMLGTTIEVLSLSEIPAPSGQ